MVTHRLVVSFSTIPTTKLEETMEENVEGSNEEEGKQLERDHGVIKKTYALIPLSG
jgi:hypothetical protein